MASKYGQQLYGADLYSSSVAQLVGVITIAPALAGRLTESEPLQGAIILSVGTGGRLTESEPVAGGISFAPILSGNLLQTSRYRGNIDVFPVVHGDLFRVGSRDYEGRVTVSVVLSGILSVLWRIKSDVLYVSVILQSDEIYLGEFWKPDEPIDGPWGPVAPVDEFWEPISGSEQWPTQ